MSLELTPEIMTMLTGLQATVQDIRTELTAVHAELRAKPAVPSAPRVSYSTEEAAEILGKAEYTIREWCRQGRINATKREERRGVAALWSISVDEFARIKDEGLLPPDPNRNVER